MKENVKEKLKDLIGPVIFLSGIAGIIILLMTVQKSLNKLTYVEKDFAYVSKVILPDTIPVVSQMDETIGVPYTLENIREVRGFYDSSEESEYQQKALIFYDNTYIQNSGIDYSNGDVFDVVSVLDGTVTNIKEDQMLGNIVEIKHSNELISVYQSLSEITVKKDEKVTKGQVIGKSGTNNISANLDNHLHLELYYKGQVVNPNDFYNKTLDELN